MLYTDNHFSIDHDHMSIVAHSEYCVQYHVYNGKNYYLAKHKENVLAKLLILTCTCWHCLILCSIFAFVNPLKILQQSHFVIVICHGKKHYICIIIGGLNVDDFIQKLPIT